jgi:TRAP-type C4-dicarboxylate transport system substrate-binding protein
MIRRNLLVIALAAGGTMLQAPAFAQEAKTKLKVADSFPAAHYMSKIIKKWMQDVTEASGNAVEFEYFGAEQLGKAKDMLTLVQSGVTDIAYVAPAYVSEKMPLSSVAELPGGFDKSCTGTHAYWTLATGDGIIAKREMQPNGVHLLFTALGPPYQILSTKKIEGVPSLAGQKLRSYGGHQDTALKELGAVPVRMAAPEMYEAVTRATLDGVVIPYASVFSYKLQDVVKYATDGLNFGSVAFNYVMNEQKWKSLSPKVRAAFEKVGPMEIEYACQYLDKDASDAYEKLKAGGVNMVKFSRADETLVREKLSIIPKLWSTELDKRGKPGTEVLRAFEAALSK